MAKIFPSEFSDLLSSKGQKFIGQPSNNEPAARFGLMDNIIKPEAIAKIETELDKSFYPGLRNYHTPVPKDEYKKIRKNFTERLGKSMQMKSAMLNDRRSASFEKAEQMGLITMLNSASFRKFGELMLGVQFGDPCGKQIICYEEGGYVSPHTDYLPEFKNVAKGYLDVHIMFSNSSVKHQWLVYENNGYLNNSVSITARSAIAVYHLPFWHYTTPLIGRKSATPARRWLLLSSFEKVGS